MESQLEQKDSYRILVIDDTRIDREIFKDLLERTGYLVKTAVDGQEGLELLKKVEFDLVLCDYMMQQMNGHEFLRAVRQDSSLKHQIVIIVTSDESEETKLKLLNAGANDFIHKKATHAEVIARVKAHLNFREISSLRVILETAGHFAYEINKPLFILIAALDTLKAKIEKEIVEKKSAAELLEIIKSLNTQANRIMKLADDIKRLGMDRRSYYKIEEKIL